MVNIYKHAFTFWHHPDIEPGTFRSQVSICTTASASRTWTLSPRCDILLNLSWHLPVRRRSSYIFYTVANAVANINDDE